MTRAGPSAVSTCRREWSQAGPHRRLQLACYLPLPTRPSLGVRLPRSLFPDPYTCLTQLTTRFYIWMGTQHTLNWTYHLSPLSSFPKALLLFLSPLSTQTEARTCRCAFSPSARLTPSPHTGLSLCPVNALFAISLVDPCLIIPLKAALVRVLSAGPSQPPLPVSLWLRNNRFWKQPEVKISVPPL